MRSWPRADHPAPFHPIPPHSAWCGCVAVRSPSARPRWTPSPAPHATHTRPAVDPRRAGGQLCCKSEELMNETLQIDRIGATAALNGLDLAMRQAFGAAIAGIRDDAGIRAVVLTGAGGHFCAGGDVRAMVQGQGGQRDIFEGRERMRSLHRWFDELVDLEKPVIAAVDGAAFGAGLSLALAADFVLAT